MGHDDFNFVPYDLKNLELAGKEHGVGIPGKVGTKQSGYSVNAPMPLKKGKPPRKMG